MFYGHKWKKERERYMGTFKCKSCDLPFIISFLMPTGIKFKCKLGWVYISAYRYFRMGMKKKLHLLYFPFYIYITRTGLFATWTKIIN